MVTQAECPPRLDNAMSDELVMQNAFAYAASHDVRLTERLGFGVHGIILAAEDKSGGGRTAIKAHRER